MTIHWQYTCLKRNPTPVAFSSNSNDWPVINNFGTKNNQFNLHLTNYTHFFMKRDKTGN